MYYSFFSALTGFSFDICQAGGMPDTAHTKKAKNMQPKVRYHGWNLEPFFAPNPFNSLVICPPILLVQK